MNVGSSNDGKNQHAAVTVALLPVDSTATTTSNEQSCLSVNEVKFHPISCRHCKRLHKVCSKELPSCSGCQWRGVECLYDAPQKKGRVSKRKEFEMKKSQSLSGKIVSSPSSGSGGSANTSSLNFSVAASNSIAIPYEPIKKPLLDQNYLNWTRLFDIYYGDLFDDIYMIERKDLERYVFAKENENLPNKKEILAMALALKAQVEQSMCFSGAEETAAQAREALSKLFDESNFYVACTYSYLAGYEIGCGRFRTARFYVKCLDFYFDELQEDEKNLTKYQKNLRKCKQFLTTESRSESSLKTILADWYDIYEKYLGITLPTTWKDLIDQDLTYDNCLIVINMIDAMINVGRIHLKDSGNTKRLRMYDELGEYIYHGIRIRILSELNRGREMIEDSAIKITMKTESDFFIFSPSIIVTPIAIACKVHLHIAKSIEFGERQNCDANSPLGPIDYYQVLAKDLRAIKTLAKRFKKVNLVHNAMMKEMEAIIERKLLYNALSELISKNNSTETINNSQHNEFTDIGNITTAKEFFQFITHTANDNQNESQSSPSPSTNSAEQRKKEYEQSVNSLLTNFNPNGSLPTVGTNVDPFEGYINFEEIHQLFNIRYGSPISFLGSEQ